MGLDIGFVEGTNWSAPQPGPALWEHLSHYACIQNDESLTLDEIRGAFSNMRAENERLSADDIEQASAFVEWCEGYWKQRGYGVEDGIFVLLSY